MKLGDFFTSAPHARPVNPHPITFTAVARGNVLPGGTVNSGGQPVAATVTGCFIFIGGDGAEGARISARQSLRDRFIDKDGFPLPIDEGDVNVELTYQILWRALHEWDADARRAGSKLFPEIDGLRQMLEIREANRILIDYNKYVAEEHPEGLEDKPFRGTQGGSERLAAVAPRR